MKRKLIVSFSGGETSAYMSQWLWQHKSQEYEMQFVFANTGEEREETLEFIQQCSDYFGFPVTWIECEPESKTKYTIVDFFSASRRGEPFEKVIRKYGIPNIALPHCSRELKEVPITAFSKKSSASITLQQSASGQMKLIGSHPMHKKRSCYIR